MKRIEKLKHDENRFKMYTASVIKEMIDKTNELIEVVNEKEKVKKR